MLPPQLLLLLLLLLPKPKSGRGRYFCYRCGGALV
jgi:hypothetical protein